MPPRKNHHKSKKKQQQQHAAQPKVVAETELTTTTNAAFRIDNSDIYGRYLVANRDLKPAELLITELPLVIGPCVSAEPVCLGCYMPVTLQAQQYRCAACAWPICSENCRGLHTEYGHNAQECALLQAQQTNAGKRLTAHASPVTVKNLYELILIVRVLLLKTHAPARYAKLLAMESHTAERQQNVTLWQHYQQNVVNCLRNTWQLGDLYDESEIHTVCGILDVNCFEIGQNTAKARTLYPSAFLLAHDCSPNTSHTDDPLTYAIYLRTSRRVRRGEPLTLSYAYTLQGTLKRRDFMHDGKLFWCQCARCADPTELGTDCSAIVCAKCINGTVRATQPLDQNAEWACDSCDYKLSAVDLLRLLDKINNDLDTIDVHDIPKLEHFINRYRTVLRPNHYLLLSAKYSLCQVYGRIEGYLLHNMSVENVKRKERYCREFLAVIDVLEPGYTRLRGLIMYELHAPIMINAQRLLQNNEISRQDFQRTLKEVIKLLRESRDILKLEPLGSNEHEMALAAEDALVKMGCN